MKSNFIYPQIVYIDNNNYYHSKIYKISYDVILQWFKQNNFIHICNHGLNVKFGKCKNGYAVLFSDGRKNPLNPFYICHFTRHIDDNFMELILH